MSWSRSCAERSFKKTKRNSEDDDGGDAGNDELTLPVGLPEVVQRVRVPPAK